MKPEVWLRWGAPWLALVAVFLPALTATAPFLPQQQWSSYDVAALGVRAAWSHRHPAAAPGTPGTPSTKISPGDLLREIEKARARLGQAGGGTTVPLAFQFGAFIPVAIVLSGVVAVLLVLLTALRWWWPLNVAAGLGMATTIYAIAVSYWLTQTVRDEMTSAMAAARHHFDLQGLAALAGSLVAQVGLRPEAALYLILIACAMVLLLPRPERGLRTPGGA